MVTGCGGDIGTSVGRILKDLKIAERTVGIDVNADNPGLFVFDVCDTVPRCDSPEYADALKRLFKKYTPDLVMPVSEAEIRHWYTIGATEVMEGVPVIMPNAKAFEASVDKFDTAEFLRSHDLPYPWTSRVRNGPPRELPCIMKSPVLNGRGRVMPIEDQEAVDYFSPRYPDNIWQELLNGDEFTAGLYGCRDGSARTIIMKRKLSGGTSGFTVSGEIVEDPEIKRVLLALAKALDLRGSINVQLRLTKKGPCIFEINPRFSSTVAFRHKLGFKDVLWAIQERSGEPLSPYTPPKNGTKFYKGYTEYISQ